MSRYYSYTEGNGPFHIWGEGANPRGISWDFERQRMIHPHPASPEGTESVYTDRLWQWDHEKHDALCLKHFGNEGQYWNDRDPGKVSAFLSDYLGKPVALAAVWQYNHASSGFPIWLLFYRAPVPAEANA
jgi:hypothetical protein